MCIFLKFVGKINVKSFFDFYDGVFFVLMFFVLFKIVIDSKDEKNMEFYWKGCKKVYRKFILYGKCIL